MMESFEQDFLKDDYEKFSFDKYNIKFVKTSVKREEIKPIEKFINKVIFE